MELLINHSPPPSGSRRARTWLALRNVFVAGRRTSVRLERVMWEALHDIAARQQRSIHGLVTEISAERGEQSLTTAIRVYIVRFYQLETIRAERRLTRNSRSAD